VIDSKAIRYCQYWVACPYGKFDILRSKFIIKEGVWQKIIKEIAKRSLKKITSRSPFHNGVEAEMRSKRPRDSSNKEQPKCNLAAKGKE